MSVVQGRYAHAQTHRNNRHRMRAPIFSLSKICLHKMAHSKGHFYSVQTPAVKNFARSRGVRLFFSNTVFLKSLKIDIFRYLCQKFTLVGFSRKGLVLDERYTVKYSVKVVVKAKQNSKVKTKPKTRLQGMFSLFYDVF